MLDLDGEHLAASSQAEALPVACVGQMRPKGAEPFPQHPFALSSRHQPPVGVLGFQDQGAPTGVDVEHGRPLVLDCRVDQPGDPSAGVDRQVRTGGGVVAGSGLV